MLNPNESDTVKGMMVTRLWAHFPGAVPVT